jgi:hypothetical protein
MLVGVGVVWTINQQQQFRESAHNIISRGRRTHPNSWRLTSFLWNDNVCSFNTIHFLLHRKLLIPFSSLTVTMPCLIGVIPPMLSLDPTLYSDPAWPAGMLWPYPELDNVLEAALPFRPRLSGVTVLLFVPPMPLWWNDGA